VVTVYSNPTIADLDIPDVFGFSVANIYLVTIKGLEPFTLTLNLAILAAVLMFASALYTSLTFLKGSLGTRERVGRVLSFLLVLVFISFLLELQPFVLKGLFSYLKTPDLAKPPGQTPPDAFAALAGILPALAGVLAPAALFLISIAQKLANLAKASLGEATWTSYPKKHGSRALLYCAAVIVPLLLWITYIYLSYWAIRQGLNDPFGPSTPSWLKTASSVWASLPWIPRIGAQIGLAGVCYAFSALALILICLLIGPNSNSLHRLYRDRLSRHSCSPGRSRKAGPGCKSRQLQILRAEALQRRGSGFCRRGATQLDAGRGVRSVSAGEHGDQPRSVAGTQQERTQRRHPYLSPLHVGSRATGYVETAETEAGVGDLTLATAMATSGAAASANMGVDTIKILTFSLSLLNIRLGYWLANPARLDALRRRLSAGAPISERSTSPPKPRAAR
jgi:hypothetical protein